MSERKGPAHTKSPSTAKLPPPNRGLQPEEPAEVGINLATGEIYADGMKRTRVREVPQQNLSVGGGVEKDTPAQVISGADADKDEDR